MASYIIDGMRFNSVDAYVRRHCFNRTIGQIAAYMGITSQQVRASYERTHKIPAYKFPNIADDGLHLENAALLAPCKSDRKLRERLAAAIADCLNGETRAASAQKHKVKPCQIAWRMEREGLVVNQSCNYDKLLELLTVDCRTTSDYMQLLGVSRSTAMRCLYQAQRAGLVEIDDTTNPHKWRLA